MHTLPVVVSRSSVVAEFILIDLEANWKLPSVWFGIWGGWARGDLRGAHCGVNGDGVVLRAEKYSALDEFVENSEL